MKKALLGIDLGTSSVKVRLTQEDGVLLGQTSRSYPTSHPKDGWAEQNPEDWWQATITATREVLYQSPNANLAGIGLTGQMHSSVLIDKNGNPLRPAITWMDTRSKDLVSLVKQRLDQQRLLQIVLNEPSASLTLLPLLWLKNMEPGLVTAKTSNLLFVKDYIRFKLTGEIGVEATDGSASLAFDVANRTWADQLIETFELPRSIFPKVSESFDLAGYTTSEMESVLGIAKGIPVAYGAGDQQAAALATGVTNPGDIQLMLGTGAQVLTPVTTFNEPFLSFLNIFCHTKGGLAQGSGQNAGSALNWVRTMLGIEWEKIFQVQNHLNPASPFFLPYLTGERAPIVNSYAMGSWFDLSLSTTQEDLIYSALEGVCFSISQSIRGVIATAKRETNTIEIRCSGGGASQHSYVQLISDTLGLPITRYDYHGGSVTGAVMMAAKVAGIDPGTSGCKTFGLAKIDTIEPISSRTCYLTDRFERFMELQKTYLNTIRP